MNKVPIFPIFCEKFLLFSYFLTSRIPIFLFSYFLTLPITWRPGNTHFKQFLLFPIFCEKFLLFSYFLASRIPIFLFFQPLLLLDALGILILNRRLLNHNTLSFRMVGRDFYSFKKALSKTANQLSTVGRRVTSIDDLIDLYLDLADGTFAGRTVHSMTDLTLGSEDPGFHRAEVVRHFSPIVSHRRYTGPFGRGWNSPYW